MHAIFQVLFVEMHLEGSVYTVACPDVNVAVIRIQLDVFPILNSNGCSIGYVNLNDR